MSQRAPSKPKAAPSIDGAAVRRGLMAKSVQSIQAKVKGGKAATKAELELVERFISENQPKEDEAPAPGEPADILCTDQKDLARKAGIHENTVGKWKREGLADPGARPISMRGYFLLLRRRGKLSECKPHSVKGRELLRWVFTGGGEASYNPDDPTHEPPADWSGEKDRQGALKGLIDRKTAQVDLETLERERLPVAKVRERLQHLADEVRRILNGFVSIAGTVKNLTPEQRLAVADAIQAQIAKAQSELSAVRP